MGTMGNIYETVAEVYAETQLPVRRRRRRFATDEERKHAAREYQREYRKTHKIVGSRWKTLSPEVKQRKYDTFKLSRGSAPRSAGKIDADQLHYGRDTTPANTLCDLRWQFGALHGSLEVNNYADLFWVLREAARLEEDYAGADYATFSPYNCVEQRRATYSRLFPVRSSTELALQMNEHG